MYLDVESVSKVSLENRDLRIIPHIRTSRPFGFFECREMGVIRSSAFTLHWVSISSFLDLNCAVDLYIPVANI